MGSVAQTGQNGWGRTAGGASVTTGHCASKHETNVVKSMQSGPSSQCAAPELSNDLAVSTPHNSTELLPALKSEAAGPPAPQQPPTSPSPTCPASPPAAGAATTRAAAVARRLARACIFNAVKNPADILQVPGNGGYVVVRRHGTQQAAACRPAPYQRSRQAAAKQGVAAAAPSTPPGTPASCPMPPGWTESQEQTYQEELGRLRLLMFLTEVLQICLPLADNPTAVVTATAELYAVLASSAPPVDPKL